MKGDVSILCDHRERRVIDHLSDSDAPHHPVRLGVSDYAIIRPQKEGGLIQILALVERKTYADFGASIRDGRSANVEKMVHLADCTGCGLFLLLEGDPRDLTEEESHGGIRGDVILHSALRTATRSRMSILQSTNTVDTARLLVQLSIALSALDGEYLRPTPRESITDWAPKWRKIGPSELAWGAIPGIGAKSAALLAPLPPISYVEGTLPKKLPPGLSPAARLALSHEPDAHCQIAMLRTVIGVGQAAIDLIMSEWGGIMPFIEADNPRLGGRKASAVHTKICTALGGA